MSSVLYNVLIVWPYMMFFNDTATTEIYTYLHTLSLHDALPISPVPIPAFLPGSGLRRFRMRRFSRSGATLIGFGAADGLRMLCGADPCVSGRHPLEPFFANPASTGRVRMQRFGETSPCRHQFRCRRVGRHAKESVVLGQHGEPPLTKEVSMTAVTGR